jgi:hypothetical protein
MRKIMMIITITISFLAVAATASNMMPTPPGCGTTCPTLR